MDAPNPKRRKYLFALTAYPWIWVLIIWLAIGTGVMLLVRNC